MKKMIVSPSILSADFANLSKEIATVSEAGAEWLHFDVMDGHFVPNISFGVPVLKSIHSIHHMVNDVHIMISDPKFYAPKFLDAGADILTFHYEACKEDKEVQEIIDLIHHYHAKAGVSIKPNTSEHVLDPFLSMIDVILLMSVEPGFGGQSFMENSLAKIAYFRQKIDELHLKTLIEVDGGINEETARKVKEAGADAVVAGSYLFGHKDIRERIRRIR